MIETFNTINCVPYSICIYRLSKISGNNNQDISEKVYQKRRKYCIVFKRLNDFNEMLYYILQFKGEAKRINNKNGNYNLYLLAHKGSGFDSYVVSKSLSQCAQLLV